MIDRRYFQKHPLGLLFSGFLLIALGVILSTFRDYGVSWDEDIQATYGEQVAGYFLSGMNGPPLRPYFNTHLYGPLFEAAMAAFAPPLGVPPLFEVRHLLIALTSLTAYLGLHRLALRGGVRGAERRFETDYWLTSYREAALWINARNAARPAGSPPLVILVAANDLSEACMGYYLAPGIEMSYGFGRATDGELPPEFDFYVATTRFDQDRNYPKAPVVHRIARVGALFTVIKGRTP